MDWWEDETIPEDFDPYEDCTTNKGKWITECRAKRHHECVRRSIYCPGEICPGETYERTAVLERPLGRTMLDKTWQIYLILPNGKIRLRRFGSDGSSLYKDIVPAVKDHWIGTDRGR